MSVGDLVTWDRVIPDMSNPRGFRWSREVGIVLWTQPVNGDTRLKILSSDRRIARRLASDVEAI